MVLLWCDGFDHYGTGTTGSANMLDGVYAAINNTAEPRTTNPRTGTHSLLIAGSVSNIRRVFGADKTTIGLGFTLYPTTLPPSNNTIFWTFSNNANTAQVTVGITTTGQLAVYRGNSSQTLLHTSSTVITAASYQHIETKATISDTVGAVEIRVNGVTVVNLTNQDTQLTAGSDGVFAQVTLGTGASTTIYIDDLYAWDDTGSSANDFLGDRRVITLRPTADTAQSDWVSNSTGGNDYEDIDDTGPDDDTTYLAASSASMISDFDFENMPANVASITAVQLVSYMRKTDAGTCDVKMSMMSSTSIATGSTHNITEIYTYYQDIFHTDPATGSAWTSTGVDNAKMRFERTA